MTETIEGIGRLAGSVRVPGDKSVSHRAVILSALGNGKSTVRALSSSNDVLATIRAFQTIGVPLKVRENTLYAEGGGLLRFEELGREIGPCIDCGNSGTTARLLAGLLCGAGYSARLDGDESLRRRPMGRIVGPLESHGGVVTSQNGRLPITITRSRLKPISFTLPVASAQLKSAFMLAALFIEGESVIVEPVRTRDHTERMLGWVYSGIDVLPCPPGNRITVSGRGELSNLDMHVPGDISSAVFFITAALVCPRSEIVIEDVLLNPTRIPVLEVFRSMGAGIEYEVEEERPEPRGRIRVKSSDLRGVCIDAAAVPLLIDELPALAAAALFAEGETRVSGASELRVKESDRIAGIVRMVRSFGGSVEELEDGFVITGRTGLHGGEVCSDGDHRIAMAAAAAAVGIEGKTRIRDAECAAVSFPSFFQTLRSAVVS